jgi:hypothetical protein
MNIEEVAHKFPDAIVSEPVDITVGLTSAQTDRLAHKLGFDTPSKIADAKMNMHALYDLFTGTDATQVCVVERRVLVIFFPFPGFCYQETSGIPYLPVPLATRACDAMSRQGKTRQGKARHAMPCHA